MPRVFLDRRAPEYSGAIRHVAMQSGPSANEGALSDSQMTRRAGLSHHDRSATHDRAPRKSRLRHDQGVFTDVAVVSDLDQIIDLRAASNTRFVEGCAIDRRIGSDFDVVLDDDATPLGHGDGTTIFVRHVAEAIRAEYDTGLKYDAIPDSSVLAQDSARVDPTITADLDLRHQSCVRRDDAAGAHATIRPHDRAGFDRRRRVDDRTRVDMRTDRNALGRASGRCKFSNQSRKIVGGLGAAKGRSTLDVDARRYNERPGLAQPKSGQVCGVAKEDQLIGFCLTQRCETRDLEALVTLNGTSEQGRQLGQSDRPERSRHDLAGEEHGNGRGPCH